MFLCYNIEFFGLDLYFLLIRGKLIPSALEEMIVKSLKDNEKPFIVALTAGTTVLGSFDPIDSVADICKKYDLWLHVDVNRLFFPDFIVFLAH